MFEYARQIGCVDSTVFSDGECEDVIDFGLSEPFEASDEFVEQILFGTSDLLLFDECDDLIANVDLVRGVGLDNGDGIFELIGQSNKRSDDTDIAIVRTVDDALR